MRIIGAHLGNPDYAWAAEIARWNPNVWWDLSGSTLIKKQADYRSLNGIFWWSAAATAHSPKSAASAFEKIAFGSDVFDGDLGELDRALERYHRMLDECGAPREAQQNIFSGTVWRMLSARQADWPGLGPVDPVIRGGRGNGSGSRIAVVGDHLSERQYVNLKR